MKRIVHNLVQGSVEWHAYRSNPKQCNASDTPAMLGVSKYKSRDALLKEKATGVAPEVDAHTQRIFDQGHEFETMARPIAIEIIGEEIYPAIMSLEIDGLLLSASLDGITMDDGIAWEHKTLNQMIDDSIGSGEIPEIYRAQMEHQLLVSGAERCLFMASRGSADTEVHAWYESDPIMRDRIIAGWKQFFVDLENYVIPETEAPKAIAEIIVGLPTINYETELVGKQIAIKSNLAEFKLGVQGLLEQSRKPLEDDMDFANAEARIKICKEAEDRIAVVKQMLIGEMPAIDSLSKELDALDKTLSQIRLSDDKQVKNRKEQIKLEVINSAQSEWTEHLNLINKKLEVVKLPPVSINLQAAIKGLKTIASLKSKARDELARAKVEANNLSNKIETNVASIYELAKDHMFLFADIQQLCDKDPEYITAIVKQRITEHEAAEKAKTQRMEEERQTQAAKSQEKNPIQQQPDLNSSIPDDYEQYASQSPAFSESFSQVFSDEPELLVDMTDHQRGVIQGLNLALMLFEKHGSAGFKKAVQDFIDVGMPETIGQVA